MNTKNNNNDLSQNENIGLTVVQNPDGTESYESHTPDGYDGHLIPAETAARKEREGNEFKHLPKYSTGSEQIETSGGVRVDKEGLLDNFAFEPEMYYETRGDVSSPASELLDTQPTGAELRQAAIQDEVLYQNKLHVASIREEKLRQDEIYQESLRLEAVRRENVRTENRRKETAYQDGIYQEELHQEKLTQDSIRQGELRQQIINQETSHQEELRQDKLNSDSIHQEELCQEEIHQDAMDQENPQPTGDRQGEIYQNMMDQETFDQDEMIQEKLYQDEIYQENLHLEAVRQENMRKEIAHQENMYQEELRQETLNQDSIHQEEMRQKMIAQETCHQEEMVQEELRQEEIHQDIVDQEKIQANGDRQNDQFEHEPHLEKPYLNPRPQAGIFNGNQSPKTTLKERKMTSTKLGVGTFANDQTLFSALTALKDERFTMDQVSVVGHNLHEQLDNTGANTSNRLVDAGNLHTDDNKAGDTAVDGAIAGGAVGGFAGLLVGLGLLSIPGVGPVLLAGGATATAIATALSGGAIGAAAGSLAGGLVGLGIPADQAEVYAKHIDRGDYLILVEGVQADIDMARSVLNDHHLHEWHVYDLPNKAVGNVPVTGVS